MTRGRRSQAKRPATSSSVSATISSATNVIPGRCATRCYQVTYRDPTSWCTSATLNHTDGYRITWTP